MSGPLFVANLAGTVLALALAVVAGRTGRRPAHYILVSLTIVLLVLAIYQAEIFGRSFRFEAWRLHVHLGFAFAALLVLPGAAITGLRLAVGRSRRATHRRWVVAFILLTLFAMLTAGWMFLTAEPLPA